MSNPATKIVPTPGLAKVEPAEPTYLETVERYTEESREGHEAYDVVSCLYEYRGQRVVAVFQVSEIWGTSLNSLEREDGGLLFRDAEFLRSWFEALASKGVIQ